MLSDTIGHIVTIRAWRTPTETGLGRRWFWTEFSTTINGTPIQYVLCIIVNQRQLESGTVIYSVMMPNGEIADFMAQLCNFIDIKV